MRKRNYGEALNLHATTKQKLLIYRAAEALGRSRSDFMLEAACREAEEVRRYFVLSEDAFNRFMGVLDRAPTGNPRLFSGCFTQRPFGRSARSGDSGTARTGTSNRAPMKTSADTSVGAAR
jgi:uncharacterized protein (DUF1778 family)